MQEQILESLQTNKTYTFRSDTFHDFQLKINLTGTKDNPYVLKGYNKAYFKGDSCIEITGDYVVLDGLNFKNCTSPQNIKLKASHCTITNCKFYSPSDHFDHMVYIKGQNNVVENNIFEDIKYSGLCIFLNRQTTESDNLLIRKNTFRDRYEVDGYTNGLEIIRIGTSTESLSASNSSIIDNTFSNCNGEVETISIKSCKNLVKGNILRDSTTITLRHGNDNVVTNNEFYKCGGLRIGGENHTVENNSFVDCTKNIVLLCGQKNPELNGYTQVKNLVLKSNNIANNGKTKIDTYSIEKTKSDCVLPPIY